jgi:PHD/YefM family antitoxin component YafN of YafNO toxin-antitoxin module
MSIVFSAIKGYNKGTLFSTKFDMNIVSLQDIKSHGAKAIPDGKVSYLIVNSKTKSVLVPPAEYEMLVEALEELEDIRIIEERKNEPTVGWNEVFPHHKK